MALPGQPNLMDWLKLRDPDGSHADIVEQLDQQNDVVHSMPLLEANSAFGYRTTVRTGIATATWLKWYQGAQPSKGKTAQITATIGQLASLLEVDKKEVEANGEPAEFMAGQVAAHYSGMAQEIAQTSVYGDEVSEPESFTGLLQHYNDRSAASGENILGSTDTTANKASIWLIGWGYHGVFGIFPKGAKSIGLDTTDYGYAISENIDGNGGRKPVRRVWCSWDLGLCVRDWRSSGRYIVDQSTLTKNAASGQDLIDGLTELVEKIPQKVRALCNMQFLANGKVRSFLRRQIANKVANSTLMMETVAGKSVMTFDGIPFGREDQLLITEQGIA